MQTRKTNWPLTTGSIGHAAQRRLSGEELAFSCAADSLREPSGKTVKEMIPYPHSLLSLPSAVEVPHWQNLLISIQISSLGQRAGMHKCGEWIPSLDNYKADVPNIANAQSPIVIESYQFDHPLCHLTIDCLSAPGSPFHTFTALTDRIP